MLYPIFPRLERDVLVFHGKSRQRFHLGWLAPSQTLADLKNHLSSKFGFGNHFIAWDDADQVLSWRKLTSFNDQYHLRVFSDGEIRGHYERTPEGSPVSHFLEKGEEERKEDFEKFLAGYVVDKQYPRKLNKDDGVSEGEPEITYADSSLGK